jgi:chromosome partitioning protein
MKTLAFFNNKGGVGKTSLVYHLAFMLAEKGKKVVIADLDPQANLTSMCLDESLLESIWNDNTDQTIQKLIAPLKQGIGDIKKAKPIKLNDNLFLLAGSLELSNIEDELSDNWPKLNDGDQKAFRHIAAFHRIIVDASNQVHADITLIDVGPNLGAINRSALISADFVAIPLAPDMFSLQGLKNLGPVLKNWRELWSKRKKEFPSGLNFTIPEGLIYPIGYVAMQPVLRADRPVKAYDYWMQKIPKNYRHFISGDDDDIELDFSNDPYCLASLKHYKSLMPMAQEARKPMFKLSFADGIQGSHIEAVKACYSDFSKLADNILHKMNI